MMKKLFSLASFLAFFGIAQGQNTIDISEENAYSMVECENLKITGAAYDGVTNESIVIYKDPSIEGPITAIVNPSYFENVWDIVPSAEIRFYGSAEDDVPFLGSYNSETAPDGFILPIDQNEFRLEFESIDESAGQGFELQLFCDSSFNALPQIRFESTFSEGWAFEENLGDDVLNVCDSTLFSMVPVSLFPDSEELSIEEIMFKWFMGDGTVYRGFGLSEVMHGYGEHRGYSVTAYTQDSLGRETYNTYFAKNRPTPTYSITDIDETLCQGQSVLVEGGMNGDQIIGASTTSDLASVGISTFFGTEMAIPDGGGFDPAPMYISEILVSGFPEGTLITPQEGIENICLNFEHSYLGDLEVGIICPSDTLVVLFDAYSYEGVLPGSGFGGGNIFMGDANDATTIGYVPGIGFDYCFSDDAEVLGTMDEERFNENTIEVSTFQGWGNAMVPGTYLPQDPLINFEGCPANGLWTLVVVDNIGADDGGVFDWSLTFDIELSPEEYEYPNGLESAQWQNHPWISEQLEGEIMVTPTNLGTETLIFETTNMGGCVFEEPLELSAGGAVEDVEEFGVCDLTYELPWSIYFGQIAFETGPSNEITLTSLDETTQVSVATPGNYTFSYTDNNCGFTASAEIEFLPLDHEDCVTGINEIHKNRSLQIIPNPSSGDVQLHLGLEKDAFAEVSIITMDGRLVMQEQFRFTRGEYVNLSTHELPSGTYIISIQGDTFGATDLFIKN